MRFCVAPLLGHRSIEPQSRLKRSIQSAATVGSATQCGYECPVEAGRSFRVSIEKKTAGPAKQSRRYRYKLICRRLTAQTFQRFHRAEVSEQPRIILGRMVATGHRL